MCFVISVNKSLKGKWASLACHETGSLVVQVGFVYVHAGPEFIMSSLACL